MFSNKILDAVNLALSTPWMRTLFHGIKGKLFKFLAQQYTLIWYKCNDSFVSKFATFHHMEVIFRSPAFSSWPRSMFCSLGWLRGGPSTPQLQTSSARNKAQTKSGHAPNIALLRQTLYYYAKHAFLGHCTTLHGCAKQCNTIHFCSRSWMISWISDKKSEMNVVPNIETQSTAG